MTLYEKYAVLDDQIKELTGQKEELRSLIVREIVGSGAEKVVTAVGNFTIAKLKTWTYPEKVLDLNEKFKAAKAKAESTGDATYVEN